VLDAPFLTGRNDPWANFMVSAKYRLMRLRQVVYPDVYCIPFCLGSTVISCATERGLPRKGMSSFLGTERERRGT